MNTLKNCGCVTVVLVGAAGIIFSMVRHRWGSGSPIEENVEDIIFALAATLGGLWLTLFPRAWVMANVRMGDAIIRNKKKQAEQRAPERVFIARIFGICAILMGMLMLIISIQELLLLLGVVKHP
ncbi:MAG: hypothetical protein WHX52_22065 [Anaerolineae bacterium]